jgi:NADPH-dependent F420 reductase
LEGKSIAVLGGSGALGSGLAWRWARAGLSVIVGSRDVSKAIAAAEAIALRAPGAAIVGASNAEAALQADIAVLAVPFGQRDATIDTLSPGTLDGKLLIDCTVPLVPPKVGTVQLAQPGSAVATLQARLGDRVTVVAAFQNIGAGLLQGDDNSIDCDVLVCSDSKEAADVGILLAGAAGLRGVAAGPLANAVAAEALTSVLITINRRYGASHAGIRITGLPG